MSLPERQEASGTQPGVINTSDSHLGELVLSCGHWCWQVLFWNPRPHIYLMSLRTRTYPHLLACRHQYWETSVQSTIQVTTKPYPLADRLVIAFLPRTKCLNFMAAVTICSDFEAQENSLSLFPLFPHLFPWRDGTGCHDLHFLNVEL